MKKRPLTTKQQAFIDQYFLCNFNGTEAAARAGYKGNRQTLSVVASENLRKPKIRSAIRERLKEQTIAADEVLWRLSQQATASYEDFLALADERPDHPAAGADVDIDLYKARDRGRLHVIRDFETTETVLQSDDGREITLTRRTKLKLHDQQRALELLARHYGLFADPGTEDNPHHITIDNLPAIQAAAAKELAAWQAGRFEAEDGTGTAELDEELEEE